MEKYLLVENFSDHGKISAYGKPLLPWKNIACRNPP